MPDYNMQVSGPDLRGLDQASAPVRNSSSTAEIAGAISSLVGMGVQAYGSSAAKKAGQAIGGASDTYEAAGQAADQAAQELKGLTATKAAEQGADVTLDQAKDLKNQVFGKLLSNQKRIQSALDRGFISSSEATARLNVLRNEALANPLIAPFQDQLDNALYTTTGGSGTTFAATAEELAAQAKQKGALEATEATQKEVTSMIQSGVVSNEKQALNYIAQAKEQERQLQVLSQKKSELGLSSQEVYAASQIFQTQQASASFRAITDWQSRGGLANEKQFLQQKIVDDGERTKQAIRAQAFDKNGKLLIEADQLSAQIGEADKRVRDFVAMIDDQSGTKMMTDQIGALTASMDLKSAQVNLELSKQLPIVYALRTQPVMQKYFLDAVTETNKLSVEWQASTNPIKRLLLSLPDTELTKKVAKANTNLIENQNLSQEDMEILSSNLLKRGGGAVADKLYKDDPEKTLTNLSNIPFTIKGVTASDEWKRKASTPEGADQLAAIVQGAASRALVASVYAPDRQGAYSEEGASGGRGTRYKTTPSFSAPESVTVVQNEPVKVTGGGRGSGNTVGKKFEEWTIDTGGVIVSDEYKSELVNAYKLGTEQPAIWQDDFESKEAWLNHLFARPKGAQQ